MGLWYIINVKVVVCIKYFVVKKKIIFYLLEMGNFIFFLLFEVYEKNFIVVIWLYVLLY